MKKTIVISARVNVTMEVVADNNGGVIEITKVNRINEPPTPQEIMESLDEDGLMDLDAAFEECIG